METAITFIILFLFFAIIGVGIALFLAIIESIIKKQPLKTTLSNFTKTRSERIAAHSSNNTPALNGIYEQVKKLDGGTRFLASWEIKELPSILWENEILKKLAQGVYNEGLGILIATDKRILFINKGFVSLQVEDFPYEKITSIQYHLGALMGTIHIYCAGNKSVITGVARNQAKDFADFVRTKISDISENINQTANPKDDAISKIERLAALKDKGIITEEEFINQKKSLLENV